jgi:hypothetical protein
MGSEQLWDRGHVGSGEGRIGREEVREDRQKVGKNSNYSTMGRIDRKWGVDRQKMRKDRQEMGTRTGKRGRKTSSGGG